MQNTRDVEHVTLAHNAKGGMLGPPGPLLCTQRQGPHSKARLLCTAILSQGINAMYTVLQLQAPLVAKVQAHHRCRILQVEKVHNCTSMAFAA